MIINRYYLTASLYHLSALSLNIIFTTSLGRCKALNVPLKAFEVISISVVKYLQSVDQVL